MASQFWGKPSLLRHPGLAQAVNNVLATGDPSRVIARSARAKSGNGEGRVHCQSRLSLGLSFREPPETRQRGRQTEMRQRIIPIGFDGIALGIGASLTARPVAYTTSVPSSPLAEPIEIERPQTNFDRWRSVGADRAARPVLGGNVVWLLHLRMRAEVIAGYGKGEGDFEGLALRFFEYVTLIPVLAYKRPLPAAREGRRCKANRTLCKMWANR